MSSRLSRAENSKYWFCRSHSPALSQMGQSSGWFSSRNSRLPTWAYRAWSLVFCVFTTMSGPTGVVHDVISLRWPSTST